MLSTVDREDLENDWLAPERQCWWSKGIPWAQALSSVGTQVAKHPTSKLDELE